MTRIVKLEQLNNAGPVWVNPTHVVSVDEFQGGSTVHLADGRSYAFAMSGPNVVRELTGAG